MFFSPHRVAGGAYCLICCRVCLQNLSVQPHLCLHGQLVGYLQLSQLQCQLKPVFWVCGYSQSLLFESLNGHKEERNINNSNKYFLISKITFKIMPSLRTYIGGYHICIYVKVFLVPYLFLQEMCHPGPLLFRNRW